MRTVTVIMPDTTPEFHRKVYEKLLEVPKGKVTTYRDLAHALNTGAYRAVGQAMRRNPCAPIVPCHRVIASDGSLGGFNGKTEGDDVARKSALLAKEGVRVDGGRVDLGRHRHRFS